MQEIVRHHAPTSGTARLRAATVGLLVGLLAACSPGDIVGSADVPTNLRDPALIRTPSGALQVYNGALGQFRNAFTKYVATSGELGDELEDGLAVGDPLAGSAFSANLDMRYLPEQTETGSSDAGAYVDTYAALQKVRGQAAQGIGLLRDYAPDASPALRGHLYAMMGYSEVMLAELFCSGIPLSTLDYNGDYTLAAGSSTGDVLQHAVALFDTAITLSADSARYLNLARIGKGRALLGLGDFAAAAQAVQDVPDGYRYAVTYSAANGLGATNFARIEPGKKWTYLVPDREGVNGLDYRSSNDPRTAVSAAASDTNRFGVRLYHPNKYATDGSSSIVLADAVEARLIQAEAELQAGDASWLGTLNALRESAITPALPDTTDPGDPDARVNLLFRERGFWLFLTGHRQGDLRRLIREYGRAPEQVYPTGAYPAGAALYGNDVTAPIPSAERQSNPNFSGCLNRGA
jgi:hypothetical protein